jgi:hypothetical protein
MFSPQDLQALRDELAVSRTNQAILAQTLLQMQNMQNQTAATTPAAPEPTPLPEIPLEPPEDIQQKYDEIYADQGPRQANAYLNRWQLQEALKNEATRRQGEQQKQQQAMQQGYELGRQMLYELYGPQEVNEHGQRVAELLTKERPDLNQKGPAQALIAAFNIARKEKESAGQTPAQQPPATGAQPGTAPAPQAPPTLETLPPELRQQVINQYLAQVAAGQPPAVIGAQPGAAAVGQPPASIKDAKQAGAALKAYLNSH